MPQRYFGFDGAPNSQPPVGGGKFVDPVRGAVPVVSGAASGGGVARVETSGGIGTSSVASDKVSEAGVEMAIRSPNSGPFGHYLCRRRSLVFVPRGGVVVKK